jgi:hypothetical protein
VQGDGEFWAIGGYIYAVIKRPNNLVIPGIAIYIDISGLYMFYAV